MAVGANIDKVYVQLALCKLAADIDRRIARKITMMKNQLFILSQHFYTPKNENTKI